MAVHRHLQPRGSRPRVGKAQGKSRMLCRSICRSAQTKRTWSTTTHSPRLPHRDCRRDRIPCALCTLCTSHTSGRCSGHRTTPSIPPGSSQGTHSLHKTRA
eukprot:scaffold53740_cov68-Phaeocystis_antarctica.AAC.4